MDAFGYGFKTPDRILRFQRFFRLAEQSAHPRLVELAAQAGYADQAHLTREVQRLCGATPSELIAQFSAPLADSFKTPHAYSAYVEAHEPYSEHDLSRNPTRMACCLLLALPVCAQPKTAAFTVESRTITVRIDRPFDQVYGFLVDPANWNQWAFGLGKNLRQIEQRMGCRFRRRDRERQIHTQKRFRRCRPYRHPSQRRQGLRSHAID
jgi:hypothetical protein